MLPGQPCCYFQSYITFTRKKYTLLRKSNGRCFVFKTFCFHGEVNNPGKHPASPDDKCPCGKIQPDQQANNKTNSWRKKINQKTPEGLLLFPEKIFPCRGNIHSHESKE